MDRAQGIESGALPVLTEGGIIQLIESEGHFSFVRDEEPTLQIVNIRRVPAK